MDSHGLSPTRSVATFAANKIELPTEARKRAVDAIIDCIGCMLAGAREELADPLVRTLSCHAQPSVQAHAVLVGAGRYAAPCDAALFNGTVAHALDFDDTNHPAYTHPTAVLLPAMLAVAPIAKSTGAELVTAYVIGFDLLGKLGRALNTAHYTRGWHPTSSFGSLAAAVVAARLLRLDRARIETALGIAASSAGGLRANFGSMVKPLHAGLAARNGVLAALLAAEGFSSGAGILERQFGYCLTFNDGLSVDLTPLMTSGEPIEILTEYGLALKPYPSCGATHPGIEAILVLRQQLQPGEEVISIRAGVPEMALEPLIHQTPATPLEAKFSMQFCLAAALLDGKVDLDTFDDHHVKDNRLRALANNTTMEVDDRVRTNSEFATFVVISTDRGRQLEHFVPLAQGKPERWPTATQLEAKFMTCATRTVADKIASQIFARVQTLDCEKQIDDLCRMLSGPTHAG